MYLTAVSDACGGTDSLVLDNIVHYADPHIRMTMLSRLDMHQIDHIRQAEELAQLVQSTLMQKIGAGCGQRCRTEEGITGQGQGEVENYLHGR